MQFTYMAWELQTRGARLLGAEEGKKVQNQWGESLAHWTEFNQDLWPSPISTHVINIYCTSASFAALF
jgi:hypothetical protein